MTSRTPTAPPEDPTKARKIAEEMAEHAGKEQEKEFIENAEEEAEQEGKDEAEGKQVGAELLGLAFLPMAMAGEKGEEKTLEDTKEFKEAMGEKEKWRLFRKTKLINEADNEDDKELRQHYANEQQAKKNLEAKNKELAASEPDFKKRIAGAKSSAEMRDAVRQELAKNYGIDATGMRTEDLDRALETRMNGRDRLDDCLDHPDNVYSDVQKKDYIKPHEDTIANESHAFQQKLDAKYGSLDSKDQTYESRYDKALEKARAKHPSLSRKADSGLLPPWGAKDDPYVKLMRQRVDQHSLHRFNYELLRRGVTNDRERNQILNLLAREHSGQPPLSYLERIRLAGFQKKYGPLVKDYRNLRASVIDKELRRFEHHMPKRYKMYHGYLQNTFRKDLRLLPGHRPGLAGGVRAAFSALGGNMGNPITGGINRMNGLIGRGGKLGKGFGGLLKRLTSSLQNPLGGLSKWKNFYKFGSVASVVITLILSLALGLASNSLFQQNNNNNGTAIFNNPPITLVGGDPSMQAQIKAIIPVLFANKTFADLVGSTPLTITIDTSLGNCTGSGGAGGIRLGTCNDPNVVLFLLGHEFGHVIASRTNISGQFFASLPGGATYVNQNPLPTYNCYYKDKTNECFPDALGSYLTYKVYRDTYRNNQTPPYHIPNNFSDYNSSTPFKPYYDFINSQVFGGAGL